LQKFDRWLENFRINRVASSCAIVMSNRAADTGGGQMTKKVILEQCKRNKLYTTPRLNDVLYLHFQGFAKIENLDEYSGLKCLWLESNAISKIEGLEHQPHLKSLFLQNNLIAKIEGLQHCRELDTLVLSHNYIKTLENCCADTLPVLNTLNISHNQLRDIEGLEVLKRCENLSILDLSFNKIDDLMVVKILSEMPALHVLTMTGNPVVSAIPSYRKTMILECKALTYLDSRPIFPRDRACAEAWKRGGYAAEKREHEQWNKEERRKIRKSVNDLLSRSRGESMLLSSSGSEDDEDAKHAGNGTPAEPAAAEGEKAEPRINDESTMEIYEGNQRELMELYGQEQKELGALAAGGTGDVPHNHLAEQKRPIDRVVMVKQVREDVERERQKDADTKMLDICVDQDRVLQMLRMNHSIEENIFGTKTAEAEKQQQQPKKKILIEEIVEQPPKIVQQKVSFKTNIEEIPSRYVAADDDGFACEMESMLWFDENESSSSAMPQSFEPIVDYQLPSLPSIVDDLSSAPESMTLPEDFSKVLELCNEQNKDKMQLCFLSENERLMQIYDEAVEHKLVQESDSHQLKEIHKLYNEDDDDDDDDDDFGETHFPCLDGLLMVKKLELHESSDQSASGESDDEEVLQFSHIEISDVKQSAENLIDGVIKSLEDSIEIPL